MNNFALACLGAALGVWLSAVAQSAPGLAYAPHGAPLTCEQVAAAHQLSWPQSYEATKDLLGIPEYWECPADIYSAPEGYLKVLYLADGWGWGVEGGGCGF